MNDGELTREQEIRITGLIAKQLGFSLRNGGTPGRYSSVICNGCGKRTMRRHAGAALNEAMQKHKHNRVLF
jgi:hypothetical protein